MSVNDIRFEGNPSERPENREDERHAEAASISRCSFFFVPSGNGIGNRTAHRTRAGRVIQEPRGPDRSGSHPKTAQDRSRSDQRAPPFAKSFISFNHERLETRLFRARGNFPAYPGEALLKAFGNQMEVVSR